MLDGAVTFPILLVQPLLSACVLLVEAWGYCSQEKILRVMFNKSRQRRCGDLQKRRNREKFPA